MACSRGDGGEEVGQVKEKVTIVSHATHKIELGGAVKVGGVGRGWRPLW